MCPKIKKIDKRMEAESVSLLRHLLDLELKRVKEDNNVDMIFFIGIDGRIFASNIPTALTPPQFHLLNLIRENMRHICRQLKAENLKTSIQQYNEGTVVISGVGNNAFLVFLLTRQLEGSEIQKFIDNVTKASLVMNHLFELRPITPESLEGYNDEIADELQKLSRLLFVEKFEETRGYKKNMEILKHLKKKLADVIGIGNVDEVVTITFNELGTAAQYMTDDLWLKFTEKIIDEHIRRLSGDMVADKCKKTWMPEIEEKIGSFL
jgi:ribosomal protein L29